MVWCVCVCSLACCYCLLGVLCLRISSWLAACLLAVLAVLTCSLVCLLCLLYSLWWTKEIDLSLHMFIFNQSFRESFPAVQKPPKKVAHRLDGEGTPRRISLWFSCTGLAIRLPSEPVLCQWSINCFHVVGFTLDDFAIKNALGQLLY